MGPQKKFTDAEVISGIRSGGRNREIVTEFLYKQYAGFVYKGQNKYRISKDEAIDAFGDSLINVCRHIENGTFTGEGKLGGYFFRAFSNKCVDILRKNSSIRVDWIEDVPEIQDGAKSILKQLILKEKITEVKSYMDQLGDICKQILLDSEYYGYSIEEIAPRIGFKNGPSVSSKKYRCLEQLRKLMSSSIRKTQKS